MKGQPNSQHCFSGSTTGSFITMQKYPIGIQQIIAEATHTATQEATQAVMENVYSNTSEEHHLSHSLPINGAEI